MGYFYYCYYDFFVKMGKNSPNAIAAIPSLSNKNNPPVGYFYYCYFNSDRIRRVFAHFYKKVIVTVIKITPQWVIFITVTTTFSVVKMGKSSPNAIAVIPSLSSQSELE